VLTTIASFGTFATPRALTTFATFPTLATIARLAILPTFIKLAPTLATVTTRATIQQIM